MRTFSEKAKRVVWPILILTAALLQADSAPAVEPVRGQPDCRELVSAMVQTTLRRLGEEVVEKRSSLVVEISAWVECPQSAEDPTEHEPDPDPLVGWGERWMGVEGVWVFSMGDGVVVEIVRFGEGFHISAMWLPR